MSNSGSNGYYSNLRYSDSDNVIYTPDKTYSTMERGLPPLKFWICDNDKCRLRCKNHGTEM